MGCDIHLRVERRLPDGTWERVEGAIPQWTKDENGNPVWPNPDPCSRNYLLFGFLADVRHRSGVEPQFAGRGIPPDTTYDRSSWELGDHSFTYATLKELLDAPWDYIEENEGYLTLPEYKAWKAKDPNAYHPWDRVFNDPLILKVTEGEADDLIASGALESSVSPVKYMVFCQWTDQPLMKSGFYRWLSTLTPIAEEAGGPENVRVLMGFDN